MSQCEMKWFAVPAHFYSSDDPCVVDALGQLVARCGTLAIAERIAADHNRLLAGRTTHAGELPAPGPRKAGRGSIQSTGTG